MSHRDSCHGEIKYLNLELNYYINEYYAANCLSFSSFVVKYSYSRRYQSMKKRNLAVVVLGTAVFGMFANTMPASAAAAEAPAFVQYEGEWPAPGNEVANIIYDTDIADDVDDAGALAMLHSYAEEGRANILATLCNSTCIYGASCLEAINIYYGRPDIPVGTYKGDAVLTPDSYYYCKPVTMKYETTLRDGADARDAVEVYREVLSAQPDNSVTIVSVGFLSNLTALLNSEPDEYSDLDGVELMRQKVKLVCCMGGNFQDFDTAEFNFMCDPASAQLVADKCPAPIVYTGGEIGSKLGTGSRRYEMELDNPVRISYDVYLTDETGEGTRPSWDLTAVMYAVEGLGDYWTLERGNVTVFDDGKDAFEKNEETGARAFLVEKMDPADVTARLDEVMLAAKKNNPNGKDVSFMDNCNCRISYAGGDRNWGNWNGNDMNFANAPGATMEFTFTGTSLDLYGGKGPDQGKFTVEIDGQQVAEVDTYDAVEEITCCIYSLRDLEPGEHTFKLTILEDKNPESSDTFVRIDGVKLVK